MAVTILDLIGITWVRMVEFKKKVIGKCHSIPGEYLKDLERIVLPQDPLLDHKVPRPVMERGYCGGVWSTLELSQISNARDCSNENGDPQYLSKYTSKV